jgi:hypothetical protein
LQRQLASIEHPLFDQFKVAIDVEHIRLRSRGTHPIVEENLFYDLMGMLKQIGVM